MPNAMIEVDNLNRSVDGKAILRGVSLTLETGCTLGLIGRTGAGKTTLLRCMLGLGFADSGTALILGDVATQLTASNKARLGYVPQTPNLPRDFTVKELIDLMGNWQKYWNAGWAAELTQRFRLPDAVRISSLSVGEQQLVSLILALGHKPALLVLDEPVSSLDPVMRRIVAATLADLQAECNTSIVFSTHILSDLERLATHIAVIEEGRIGLLREADSVRQDIVCWQIHSQRMAPPTALDDVGILHYRVRSPQQATALVDSTVSGDATSMAERLGTHIDVQTINLEDFVVEYLQ